jgi:hypothetical protein
MHATGRRRGQAKPTQQRGGEAGAKLGGQGEAVGLQEHRAIDWYPNPAMQRLPGQVRTLLQPASL